MSTDPPTAPAPPVLPSGTAATSLVGTPRPAAPPHGGTVPSSSLDVQALAENIERGFLSTHTQLSQSFGEVFQLTARLTGLAQLLVDKGVLQPAEIQAAVEKAATQLQASELGKGLKFALLSGRPDKYQVVPAQVNCAERLRYCQSACCSLDVILSPQDVEEGVARWDLAQPYHLRRSADGYCCHLARGSGGCEIYDQRPYVCRSYSCAEDKRIWLDFENMIPNEETQVALRNRRDQPRLIARNVGPSEGFTSPAAPPAEDAEASKAPEIP